MCYECINYRRWAWQSKNFQVRFVRPWLNPLSKFLDPPLKTLPFEGKGICMELKQEKKESNNLQLKGEDALKNRKRKRGT